MGAIRDSLEASLAAAVELDVVEPEKHAAVMAGARAGADALDAGDAKASMLSAYLAYCKALGIAPSRPEQERPVTGAGRVAKLRARSVTRLRAV